LIAVSNYKDNRPMTDDEKARFMEGGEIND
jgi:hypothetical protein